jgi:hypothetical protein
VECAVFADKIKAMGGSYQSPWHFIDTPYLDEGGSLPDFNFTADAHNVTEALTVLTDWIKDEGDYQSTYIYQQVMDHNNNKEDEALSTALRLIIHYTGDVH